MASEHSTSSKKDGKVRICIDFRDLNKACLKDDFPLPNINVIVDSATSSAMYFLWMGFQDIIR